MKPLVIVPARAGSKGLPGKNWKELGGKPLTQHTLEAALEVFLKDEICVTTDSTEVIAMAEALGITVPFIRPAELATDTAGSQEVLIHALKFWEANYYRPEVVILLQPTSPFRKSLQIQEALQLYSSEIDMVVGVKETKANPYFLLREEDQNGFLQLSKPSAFTRRQDCPKVYEVNGAIYIINPASLLAKPLQAFDKIVKYKMDEKSSIDIDDELDWIFAEVVINRGMV